MIGDSLSQDCMCGRYLAYANVQRLSQACDVTVEESEDPNHVCNFLNMHDINMKCHNAMWLFFIEDFDDNGSITDMSENGLKQNQKSPWWIAGVVPAHACECLF